MNEDNKRPASDGEPDDASPTSSPSPSASTGPPAAPHPEVSNTGAPAAAEPPAPPPDPAALPASTPPAGGAPSSPPLPEGQAQQLPGAGAPPPPLGGAMPPQPGVGTGAPPPPPGVAMPPQPGDGTQPPPAGGPPPVPPPMGYAGAPGAPPPRRNTGVLVAIAVVIALIAGVAGGAVGFGLASLGDSGGSSPSEQLADGEAISDVAKAVQPSVVSISAGSGEAGGSGVVYDDSGHIITNNHVAEAASGGKLEIAFADGTTSEAEVIAGDPSGDLAVIKADNASNLQPIEFGDSDSLQVGDTLLAIGSPLGLQGSVTSGIVSALDRSVQAGGEEQGGAATTLNGLIQTDAAINPGNSGGALVNGKGELVGINTVIATAGGSEGSVGLGFAIPSSTVKSTVEQLVNEGSVEHAFLGVGLTDDVSGESGAIVTEVEEGSPAEEGSIERGDVITKINDTDVSAASDVVSYVQSSDPGTEVTIEYERNGEPDSVQLELGSSTS